MSIKLNAGNAKLFTSRRQSLVAMERSGELAVIEEPFEIRILHWFKDVPKVDSLAVLMRTPGFDRELTAGYLFSESIIAHRGQLLSLHPLGDSVTSNEYLAELSRDVDLKSHVSNTRFVNSTCLSCGTRGVEAIPEPAAPPMPDEPTFDVRTILGVPALLHARSLLNASVTGLSAAALINHTGDLEAAFDDVHSSNALNKLLGHCFLAGQALADRALCLSGDCHFELVLKVIAAGCPILIVLGAPSSLAIEAARARQLTLVGLLSDEDFHVYSGESRIR
jgi:FdhD protein